ncbi:MAG: YaeQ [Proteobacteria bacterium]|uniref:YaeQ n=1 Tax=Dechloromonas aromatica (strain RCB) TaxID=159087 RepID=Q47F42_DECAR|nr:YaeQ [Pseudomonadota bacterium]
MALKSTIFKAELQLADLDRSHFGDYSLTIARHPSETDERMMVRLLAFALNASETLTFGRGLSATDDEGDLQDLDATGSVERWIDVGLPDEKLIRRACNRARHVMVLSYGGRTAELWWQQTQGKVSGQKNLRVLALSVEDSKALAGLAERGMRLQCTIQDGTIWLGGEQGHVELTPKVLFASDLA